MLGAWAASAQTSPPTDHAAPAHPSPHERATVAMLFGSVSVSMIPMSLTAACTAADTCVELNPVMRRLIGQGLVRAVTVKAGVSFASHYGIWRLPARTPKQRRIRAVAAAVLLAINVWDAVHDIRVMRQIEQRRRR